MENCADEDDKNNKISVENEKKSTESKNEDKKEAKKPVESSEYTNIIY